PATAHTIARLANGLADDLIGTTVLASHAPLVIAPAMETHMWSNAATQANVALLRERGAVIVEPESGELASGLVGQGRLASRRAAWCGRRGHGGGGGRLSAGPLGGSEAEEARPP